MAGPAIAAPTGVTTKASPTVKVTPPSVGSIGGRMMNKTGRTVVGGKMNAHAATVGGGQSTMGAGGHPK
jgi:hypothetical protein